MSFPRTNFSSAKIVASYAEERYLTNGQPDYQKMNAMILTMPDNKYWTIGPLAGDAWKPGRR